MWAGLADFIDRSPTLVGKLALPFLLVGGALHVSLRMGFIDPSAFDGMVAQAVPIIWTIGLALAVLWALGMLLKVPEAIKSAIANRRYGREVNDNLRFLDERALFLLMLIIQEQNGRCPNMVSSAFETLKGFGIMELEMNFTRNYNSHGVYRVSRFIENRSKLAQEISTRISNSCGFDVSTQDGRRRYMLLNPPA